MVISFYRSSAAPSSTLRAGARSPSRWPSRLARRRHGRRGRRAPRRRRARRPIPAATHLRDRDARSVGVVVGVHAGQADGATAGRAGLPAERNAGTTAFSPFVRSRGPRVARRPRSWTDLSLAGRVPAGRAAAPRRERGWGLDGRETGRRERWGRPRARRPGRARFASGLPGPSRGLGIGVARALIPPRSPSHAWPPEARLHLAPGDPNDLVGVDGVTVDADPAALAYGDAGLRAVSLARNIKHQRARVASRRRRATSACSRRRWSSSWDGRWSRSRAQTRNPRGSRTNSRGPSRGRTPRPPRPPRGRSSDSWTRWTRGGARGTRR